MSSLRGLVALALVLTAYAIAPAARGQTRLIRQVIGSGAVAGISPTHIVAGTIGQTIIGRSTSSTHTGSLGFWYTYPMPSQPGGSEVYLGGVTGAASTVRVAPNPVIDVASINVMLARSGDVKLALYDGLGQERMRLIDAWRSAGTTSIQLPVRELESGEYLLVLLTNGERSVTAMRVIK